MALENSTDIATYDHRDLHHSRIMKRPEVSHLTGLPRSSLYRAIQHGNFPKPVSLGARSVGWLSTDIYAFIASLEVKHA